MVLAWNSSELWEIITILYRKCREMEEVLWHHKEDWIYSIGGSQGKLLRYLDWTLQVKL